MWYKLKPEIAERRRKVAKLMLLRLSQREIARRLGVSNGLIAQDAKAILADYREQARQDIGTWVARELRKYDEDELEAREAWERSKEDREKRVQVRRQNGHEVFEDRTETEGRLPDPQYLARILAIQERRAKLLGLDSPDVTQLLTAMSHEEWMARVREVEEREGKDDAA